jgi:heparin/heparan-sulfate lyase
MIMRDMISAGIAVYDEFPEMYDLAAGRFFREHLPARNWLYNGHAYHQGDSYGLHRYSWDTFPLWIFDRLGAGNVYNPEQRWVPYLWIYTGRPDGQRLRAGDTFSHSTPRGKPWSVWNAAVFTASYYGDGYLLSQHLAQDGVGDNEALFEFLWRDTALEARPFSDLPLSRYFEPPFGWMVARTGWDENAAIVEMKVNVYNFCNHQHLDAGAFQVYYKGALAIDSGLYSGSSGQYGSPHCTNYYWRTVAHNSLLVHDPAEVFSKKSDYGNDGGQRLPNGRSEPKNLDALLKPENGYRTGEVLAHGFGPDGRVPDYTLLEGDLTAAYSSKVKQVLRSFVFLNLRNPQTPAALIVFDRVVSSNPAFRKFWLLHTLEEPRIEGAAAVVDRTEHGERGRLVLSALLPAAEDLSLEKVGGPGKEYWVFGKNYANDAEPGRRERSSLETGAWRIEISPKKPAEENLFLVVMQVTDRLSGAALPVHRTDAGDRVDCRIDGPDGGWMVLFRKDGRRAEQPAAFVVAGKGTYRVLATGLAPGAWRARRTGGGEAKAVQVAEEQGAAWFEAQAGAWTLTRE